MGSESQKPQAVFFVNAGFRCDAPAWNCLDRLWSGFKGFHAFFPPSPLPSAVAVMMCNSPFSAVAKTFPAIIWFINTLAYQEAVFYSNLEIDTNMGQPTMWNYTKSARWLLLCLSTHVVKAGLLFLELLEMHTGHFSLVCQTQWYLEPHRLGSISALIS